MDWLGDKFVDAAGKEMTREEAIGGYNLVMILYSASWWGGCTPFKNNLKQFYKSWNKEGTEKNL